MGNNNILKNLKWLVLILFSTGILVACEYDVSELGPKATASFTVTPVAGQTNRYALASTSQNSFIHDWDKGSGQFTRGSATDTVYFPDKGTYTIRLMAYGPGGVDVTTQTIVVAADDPAAFTPMKILTNNSSKTWKLAPEAGALWIGPNDFSQTWWGNSLADVGTRNCLFNDEITFNINGTMVIDNKGDFYVDEEGGVAWPVGMPSIGCHPNSAIPSQFSAWTGGNFNFAVIGNDQLKLNGTGAFLGLYKAATPPDAAVTSPQSSITYKIMSVTPQRLVVLLDYGWGAWRFTFVPAD
jgi:PKD repeat protein